VKRALATVSSLVLLPGAVVLLAGAARDPVPPTSVEETTLHPSEPGAEVEDPFATGPPPDLVVLSSSDLLGETVPCG